MGISHSDAEIQKKRGRDLTGGAGEGAATTGGTHGCCGPQIVTAQLDGRQCQHTACLQCRCKAMNLVPGHKPEDETKLWELRAPRRTSPTWEVPPRVLVAGAGTLPSGSHAWDCARCPCAHLSCSRSCVSFRRAFRCRMQTSFCCSGVRYCSGVGGLIPWLSLQRLYLAERLRGHGCHPPAAAGTGTGEQGLAREQGWVAQSCVPHETLQHGSRVAQDPHVW